MFKRKDIRHSQAGFTLVEIAIVMVIIGLLIGGIIKGQELIKNAKVKRVMKQVDEMRAAVTSYQDRYAFLPGDDSSATTHTGDSTLTNGDGNGQIASNEAPDLFMHLAASGLITGSYTTATSSYPRNAFSGWYATYWATVQGKTTHWFITTAIPGDAGNIIDTSYDDGVYKTGSIRGSADYTSASTVTMYIEF
jgi:prepilin-type N-terminal cleavage/methylation domain-containing protein